MKVYVFGGLHYIETRKIFSKLSDLHESCPFSSLVITASPTGVSLIAKVWADLNDIPIDIVDRPKCVSEEDRNKMVLAAEPDLIVAFPGGEIVQKNIHWFSGKKITLISVEDELWQMQREVRAKHKELAKEFMSLRQTPDKVKQDSLASNLCISQDWFDAFYADTDINAFKKVMSIVTDRADARYEELTRVQADASYLREKHKSLRKATSSRANGKKGGRPKKTVSGFVDTVLLKPKTSDWIEPIKEPAPVKSYTKNPGPVKVSKYE